MIWRRLKYTLIVLLWKKGKKLTLIEAEKRVRWQKIIARPVFIISIVLLSMGTVKLIYLLNWQVDALSVLLGGLIKRAIELIYLNTQFLSIFWKISPLPTVEPANSLGNYYALFLGCAVIISRLVLISAKHLSLRIHNARKKADERRWTNQMEGEQALSPNRLDISAIIFTAEPNDRWHTRPLGLTVLTVTCAVLAQIVNLSLGLV